MADGGRPRLWADPKQFEAKAEEYFEHAKAEGEPPNMADLALFLGFVSRQSLLDYEGYGEAFSCTVQKARLRIEADRQKRLLGKDTFTPGVIFDLKNNHGWKDQTQQELTGPNGGPLQVQEIALRGVRPTDTDAGS